MGSVRVTSPKTNKLIIKWNVKIPQIISRIVLWLEYK
jgi:hypothetical protein